MGTMPWVALGFTTLYLQLLGFKDMNAAILVAVFQLGCAIGSFGGGYIGEQTILCIPRHAAICITDAQPV